MFGRKKEKSVIKIKSGEKKVSIFVVAYPEWAERMQRYAQGYKDRTEVGEFTKKIPFIPPSPLTFVATQQEADYYCERYLLFKYYQHFKAWCAAHGYGIFDKDAWGKYSDTVLVDLESREEDGLHTYEMSCSQEQIAAVLRIVCDTVPVEAPWETAEEIDFSFSKLKPGTEYYNVVSNLKNFLKDLREAEHEEIQSKISEDINKEVEITDDDDEDNDRPDIFA